MSGPGKPKRILKNFRMTELSLVDEGDNPGAEVVVVKRREASPDTVADAVAKFRADFEAGLEDLNTEGGNMDLEALNARLGEIEENLAEVTKRAETAEAKVTELEAERDTLKGQLDTVTKERDAASQTEEDILKGVPEVVRKRIESAESAAALATAAVEKMANEREEGEAVAKARELGVGKAEDLGPLLVRVRKGKTTEADEATLVEVLKGAGALAAGGAKHLFRSAGSNGGTDAVDGDDPEAVLKQKAEDIRKDRQAKGESITFEQAYGIALDQNPDLYDAYVAKRRPA
jgi:flagellar hook-basal body complex protein FliE